MTQDVLALLIQNEQKLHHAKTRSQKTLLERLLHREFLKLVVQVSGTTENMSSVR
ncbi:hypothetical protein PO369_16770 [Phytobacter diazotrophicus]|uniref:hypothetical protein n=1 Tax=Phytobacter diazotrophicus TaxID=395631 RepID=UPI002FF57498